MYGFNRRLFFSCAYPCWISFSFVSSMFHGTVFFYEKRMSFMEGLTYEMIQLGLCECVCLLGPLLRVSAARVRCLASEVSALRMFFAFSAVYRRDECLFCATRRVLAESNVKHIFSRNTRIQEVCVWFPPTERTLEGGNECSQLNSIKKYLYRGIRRM